MPEAEFQLRQEEARLLFLAIAYHLGRPGSELDPLTKRPVEQGLAAVARELQPQLRQAMATVRLAEPQTARLRSAMLGCISELKSYAMFRATPAPGGRSSTVPGFDASLRHLFPEVEEDAEEALGVAERMLLLKRRLDQALPAASQEPEVPRPARRRRWWPGARP